MNSFHHFSKTAALTCLMGLAPFSLFAADWTGANQADWNTGANWTGGIVPGDTGYIGNTGIKNSTTAWISSTVPNIGTGRLEISNSSGFDVRSGGSITFESQLWLMSNATANVSGGSLTSNDRFYIGFTAGTSAEVNLQSGTITDNGVIWLGSGGSHGTLNISGGTLNANGNFNIGRGSNINTGAGTGTINLTDGAVNIKSQFIVGMDGGIGTFNQSGGSVTRDGNTDLIVGRNDGAGGTYRISGGTIEMRNLSNTGPNGRFEVTGNWDVANVADEIRFVGALTLNQATSVLAFNLSEDGIKRIAVSGNVDLSNATLEIGLADGYNGFDLLGGGAGTTFELVNAGGTFTTADLKFNLTDGLSLKSWEVSDNSLFVTVIPEPSSALLLLSGFSIILWRHRK